VHSGDLNIELWSWLDGHRKVEYSTVEVVR
jgi:hypothetical protein